MVPQSFNDWLTFLFGTQSGAYVLESSFLIGCMVLCFLFYDGERGARGNRALVWIFLIAGVLWVVLSIYMAFRLIDPWGVEWFVRLVSYSLGGGSGLALLCSIILFPISWILRKK
jgi:hypothetical protein